MRHAPPEGVGTVTAPKQTEDLIKVRWEPHEDQILVELWPDGTVPEISASLPGRTIRACASRARVLGIKCTNRQHLNKVVSPVFMREGVPGKFCTGPCREWLPLEKFGRHQTCAGGRRNICSTCEGRVAQEKHSERRCAAVRAYQIRNPEKTRHHQMNARHKRRAYLKIGVGVSPEQIRELFELFGGMCAYCKTNEATTIDHVIPLSRGGEHIIENIVPACLGCNCSKQARTPEEWSAARARKEK
jgi:5-methylcytosine-specific restriction endonuclease McrA